MTMAKTVPRYRVVHWPAAGVIIQVMPWVVICRAPKFGFPIVARCYTRAAALRICRALNAQKGTK
jgi:hypothetical protein